MIGLFQRGVELEQNNMRASYASSEIQQEGHLQKDYLKNSRWKENVDSTV